jgi:hypothetical protein
MKPKHKLLMAVAAVILAIVFLLFFISPDTVSMFTGGE